jgi:hypothetical protein
MGKDGSVKQGIGLKVGLPLGLINKAPRHEDVWEEV